MFPLTHTRSVKLLQLVSLRQLLVATAINTGNCRHAEDTAAGELIAKDLGAKISGIKNNAAAKTVFFSPVCTCHP
jgi:hypothetical protein